MDFIHAQEANGGDHQRCVREDLHAHKAYREARSGKGSVMPEGCWEVIREDYSVSRVLALKTQDLRSIHTQNPHKKPDVAYTCYPRNSEVEGRGRLAPGACWPASLA